MPHPIEFSTPKVKQKNGPEQLKLLWRDKIEAWKWLWYFRALILWFNQINLSFKIEH